jgi:serine/threonine-protein kinase
LSLWTEVRQRRITQIVVTYLAGGWMALAVVDQLVDREVLPLVAYQVGLTLYAIGILAALVIGWYHGEKGVQKAPRSEITSLAVIGVAALVASGLVVRNATNEAQIRDALNPDDLRRIAVLYLDDMSRDQSMRAVADGVTEGLISRLTEVRELRVTSRNGSREARELGPVPADSIATVLDVGALVDGTIDQAGDELRVTIRLLERTGQPLFRETYRWPADQVATVGTNLATEVANALREQLGLEIRLRESREDAPNTAAWLQVARAERSIKDAAEAVGAGDPEGTHRAFEAADTELEAAMKSAPGWAKPLVLRAEVAYERYVLAHSADQLIETLDAAVEHADAALRLEPDNAAALEWRGTARYRRWLLRADDDRALEDLFAQARSDLTRAERLDPTRASVKSTLSHLYYQIDDWAEAVLAARSAYDLDAFLDAADGVLWRLFTAYYDLGDHENADGTCERGHERFPRDYRFVQCRILVMTMPAATPDVDRAWELHEDLQPLLVEAPEFFDAQARVMIAAIMGRAGLMDGAQTTFAAARVGPEIDPERELLSFEAAMRSVIGDVDGSIATLREFVVANSEHAPGQHWWWRNVERHPDFERYRALH